MVYEFKIEEISSTVVPVRADSPDEAQKIFDTWYKKHTEDGSDTTVYDLIDNGYQGRHITRSVGRPDCMYSPDDIMLPEESDQPYEPTYSLHIRFSDGSRDIYKKDLTLGQVGRELTIYGSGKYMLLPDAMNNRIFSEDAERNIWIRAVLKDEEETWIE